MGVARAPVVGSGCAPAWTASVANPGTRSVMVPFLAHRDRRYAIGWSVRCRAACALNPPVEGEGRQRASASWRGGVMLLHPHPGSRLTTLADLPPPGGGRRMWRAHRST